MTHVVSLFWIYLHMFSFSALTFDRILDSFRSIGLASIVGMVIGDNIAEYLVAFLVFWREEGRLAVVLDFLIPEL